MIKKGIFCLTVLLAACVVMNIQSAHRMARSQNVMPAGVAAPVNEEQRPPEEEALEDTAEQEVAIEMEDHVVPKEEIEMEEEEEVVPTEQAPSARPTPAEEFDVESKRKAVMGLIDQGVAYFSKHSDDQAFHAFTHDKRFIRGELYLFVFDNKGTCMAHGQEHELIWQNLYNVQDTFGVYVVQAMLDKAKQGGGWVTYQWRNATEMTYVKEVTKGDKRYIIGCGYFPHSKIDAVVNLVKGAVALFNQTIAEGKPIEQAFSSMSYPLGRFVFGDLYLYALNFDGVHMAHGELPGLIGTNGISYQDATGKYVNQEIIKRLKNVELGTGVWVDYISKNAPKKAYAEKVVDKQGKYYFISCGYYPTADRDQAENLVKKGYQFMKSSGKTAAAQSFTDRKNMQFRYGDLYLFVYDMKGLCVAHGGNSEYVGTNQYNLQDEDGDYYIQEMIKKAQAGGGWIEAKLKNSFEVIYVEKVDLGVDSFVIGCGLYPITKYETMMLVAKSGADYLKTHDLSKAFNEFVKKKDGSFIRGDLDLFVFDNTGICYVYGDDFAVIWRNLFNINDDDGKPFVKIMINTVKRGPGVVSFKLNGVMKTSYVVPVEKNGKQFIVGSSFYH